jgi:hypothetical protein
MASQWAGRQSVLAFALADFTFFVGYMRPRLQRIDGPHGPGERSNGLNAAYVISKQSLYRPDLLLTFGKATFSALRDSGLACSMYPHMEEDVYTAHAEGPFRARMYFTGAVRSLEGIASTHPIRSAPVCRFILRLRHAKPVDAMVSVQILFHALSCHKYLASLHSPPSSSVLLLDAHR